MKRSLKLIESEVLKKPRKRLARCDHNEVRRLRALVAGLKAQVKSLQSENVSLWRQNQDVLAENASLKEEKTTLLDNSKLHFDELPKDIVNLITEFFSEFEKFQFRGLNTTFYKSYYNQTFASRTGTNYMRVARLGALGRSFPRLTHLRIYYDSLDQDFLRFVDKTKFPKMELFAVEKFGTEVDLTKLPGHPNIKTMGLYNMEPHMLEHITEEKFPRLELLDFYPFRCRFLDNFLNYLQPHAKLKRIECLYVYHLDIEDWKVITKKRFPCLETILYRKAPKDAHPGTQPYAQTDMIPKVAAYLREQGIDFRPEEITEDAEDDQHT